MDLAHLRGWAGPLILVGQNALLAYILPGMLNNLTGLAGLPGVLYQYGSSWAGAPTRLCSPCSSFAITWGATRLGIRLRL